MNIQARKKKSLVDLITERRSSSGWKRKVADSICDDSMMKQSKNPSSLGIDSGSSQDKKTYRVGDSILRLKAKSQEKSASGKCKGYFRALKEIGTRVLKKIQHAKVVFSGSVYAETTFSSATKLSIFGPSFVSYRHKHIALTNGKSSP
ncbi:TUDOR/PWWP/MBT SUPERFAMILY PROTEIN [Salix purpurea]|uniref:TUDOR/PWWP/MBT SUPERFAMILY PROTEIN n=1 Tax=Salix purpurea TaxID=77065 RepID=A0A9Q0VVX7_SALPP|nr:TUDOR/PWWP/MBT SUPERFAMILY PROTEIN [Salix purpurea]